MSNFTINTTGLPVLIFSKLIQPFSPKFSAILIILFPHHSFTCIFICELEDGTVHIGYGQTSNLFLVVYDQYL